MTDDNYNRVYEGDLCVTHNLYHWAHWLLFEVGSIDEKNKRVFPLQGSLYETPMEERHWKLTECNDIIAIPEGFSNRDFFIIATAKGSILDKQFAGLVELYNKVGV